MAKDSTLNIVCLHNGYIPHLNMCGPIVQPMLVYKETVVKMLMAGLKISKYDTENKTYEELTLDSINNTEVTTEIETVPDPLVEEASEIKAEVATQEVELGSEEETVKEKESSNKKDGKNNKKNK